MISTHKRSTGGVAGHGRRFKETIRNSVCTAVFICSSVGMAEVQTLAQDLKTGQKIQLAQADQTQTFSIPPQPLPSALDTFSRQTGIAFAYATGQLQGIQSPGVSGTYTPKQALEILLAGTGLVFQYTSDTTVALTQLAQGDSDALQLDPVKVEADAESGYAPVEGFVATQSAIATKTNTPILETPQSISVVPREQLTIRNAQTDSQTLLYVPGVWAQPFGGVQNPANPFFYIRGFSSAFGGSYVDGLVSPVNYRYEPFGIERVDVFRGPTSTLYGQSDPGGLVNRTSKRPTDEFQGELQFQAGTFDWKQFAGDISGPVDSEQRVLFRMIGLVRDAESPLNYDFGIREEDDRTYIAPSLTIRPTKDTSLTILTSFLKEEFDLASTVTDSAGNLTRINLDQQGLGTYEHEQIQAGYAFEHKFSSELQLRQNLRWSNMDLDSLGLFQLAINDATGTVSRESFGFEEERNDLVVDTQLEAALSTGPIDHTFLVGVDYQNLDDDFAFLFGAAPDLNFVNPDYNLDIPDAAPFSAEVARSSNVGVYVQNQAEILDDWILTLGGRHDWARVKVEDKLFGGEATRRDEKFTYRAGLTYVSDLGLAPYVSYTTSFFPTGGADANGNPFEPTTGEQVEVGLKYRPDAFNGFFAISLFNLKRQNVLTPDPNNQPFGRIQTGEVRSRGVELEGTIDLDIGISATASYTYNDVEVTRDNPNVFGVSNQGKRPVLAPEHLASAWIDYTFQQSAVQGLLVGGGVRYVGSNFADAQNTIENDAYTLFDAVIRYDLGYLYDPLDGTSIAVNANNVFDKEYITCFTRFDCQFGAERTVVATVGYRW